MLNWKQILSAAKLYSVGFETNAIVDALGLPISNIELEIQIWNFVKQVFGRK